MTIVSIHFMLTFCLELKFLITVSIHFCTYPFSENWSSARGMTFPGYDLCWRHLNHSPGRPYVSVAGKSIISYSHPVASIGLDSLISTAALDPKCSTAQPHAARDRVALRKPAPKKSGSFGCDAVLDHLV